MPQQFTSHFGIHMMQLGRSLLGHYSVNTRARREAPSFKFTLSPSTPRHLPTLAMAASCLPICLLCLSAENYTPVKIQITSCVRLCVHLKGCHNLNVRSRRWQRHPTLCAPATASLVTSPTSPVITHIRLRFSMCHISHYPLRQFLCYSM